jgi:hypothetical protein
MLSSVNTLNIMLSSVNTFVNGTMEMKSSNAKPLGAADPYYRSSATLSPI